MNDSLYGDDFPVMQQNLSVWIAGWQHASTIFSSFTDKLQVLRMLCTYWFCFSLWWFSGPSVLKLFQKVTHPSRCIGSRCLTRSEKQTSLSVRLESFPIRRNKVILYRLFCCFHAYLPPLYIFTFAYDAIDSPSSNAVNQLIAWLFVYSMQAPLTHRLLSDFIYFVHRS